MKTKRLTTYVLADNQTDPKYPVWVVIGPYTDYLGRVTDVEFYWTGDRRNATRWEGRKAAESLAQEVEKYLRWNTTKKIRLSILPASGGVAITRKAV